LTFFFSQSPELRSPDITEWEGSRAFGDLDLRVLANARRAEEKQIRSEIRSRVEETVLDNNSKQFDRAIRKQ